MRINCLGIINKAEALARFEAMLDTFEAAGVTEYSSFNIYANARKDNKIQLITLDDAPIDLSFGAGKRQSAPKRNNDGNRIISIGSFELDQREQGQPLSLAQDIKLMDETVVKGIAKEKLLVEQREANERHEERKRIYREEDRLEQIRLAFFQKFKKHVRTLNIDGLHATTPIRQMCWANNEQKQVDKLVDDTMGKEVIHIFINDPLRHEFYVCVNHARIHCFTRVSLNDKSPKRVIQAKLA
jgi:hypothetical protein